MQQDESVQVRRRAEKEFQKLKRNDKDHFESLFSSSAQHFVLAIPLKPQDKPVSMSKSFRNSAKSEYAVRYLESIGANPTMDNIKMVERNMGIHSQCNVSAAWKSRGSAADLLYVSPNWANQTSAVKESSVLTKIASVPDEKSKEEELAVQRAINTRHKARSNCNFRAVKILSKDPIQTENLISHDSENTFGERSVTLRHADIKKLIESLNDLDMIETSRTINKKSAFKPKKSPNQKKSAPRTPVTVQLPSKSEPLEESPVQKRLFVLTMQIQAELKNSMKHHVEKQSHQIDGMIQTILRGLPKSKPGARALLGELCVQELVGLLARFAYQVCILQKIHDAGFTVAPKSPELQNPLNVQNEEVHSFFDEDCEEVLLFHASQLFANIKHQTLGKYGPNAVSDALPFLLITVRACVDALLQSYFLVTLVSMGSHFFESKSEDKTLPIRLEYDRLVSNTLDPGGFLRKSLNSRFQDITSHLCTVSTAVSRATKIGSLRLPPYHTT